MTTNLSRRESRQAHLEEQSHAGENQSVDGKWELGDQTGKF